MENNYRDKQQKGYIRMRMVYDIGMACLILFMGIFMVWGSKLGFEMVEEYDPLMRYLFGGLCFLYGGFRFYRAFRHNY